MFIPNNTALIHRVNATRTTRGERSYAAPVRVPCGVVTLALEIGKTSVRADSSGSRGRAEEQQGTARILFPAYVKVAEMDMVQVEQDTLEIIQIVPRRNILGAIDHYEVDLRKAEFGE
jgi:hypothetical protein